ncbi:hypothetical protein SAMN06265350_101215 [Solitalea koreensis]|uniref:Uncharacterized protein n=1 Tax=Solitalea koreensis TaxID=543615 RepID=A0A521AL83_9SPHI|nr:hypothetical protein SAMN06265350_101215 [Solitalea koreensis]
MNENNSGIPANDPKNKASELAKDITATDDVKKTTSEKI